MEILVKKELIEITNLLTSFGAIEKTENEVKDLKIKLMI